MTSFQLFVDKEGYLESSKLDDLSILLIGIYSLLYQEFDGGKFHDIDMDVHVVDDITKEEIDYSNNIFDYANGEASY